MVFSLEEKILSKIDPEELVQLAVTMGNIYSPTGQEGEMVSFVYEWMDKNGFGPRLIGPTKERANVLGRYRGEGNGLALTFNSHMDVTLGKNEVWRLKVPDQKIYCQAWVEGNTIYGNGVVNDKGPMAAWMVAVKVLREAGVRLNGDVLMSAVIGEIGYEPVDEFMGLAYGGKDFGTRYLLAHGGSADLAIVAEATDFKPGWVEAGKAFFKITIHAGPSRYTPYVQHDAPEESKNAIVRAALFIPCLEQWAKEYEERYTTHFAGGTVVPKVSIGAIRAGLPYQIIRPPEVCSLYIDVRLLPGMNPLDVREDLINLFSKSGFDGEVELYLHRPGYEAVGVNGLLAELRKGHKYVLQGEMVSPPEPPVTSMWRDTNVYAEFGIPAINYGPGGGAGSGQNSLPIEDLVVAAKIYALTAYYVGQLSRAGKEKDGRKG
jgi:acetylornithine deacetylase/succinyl-diaminopimelate desuccinylase-like protein